MNVDELSTKYMCLRTALARAYGEPVWDSGHIDRLTDEIADTEFALAASGGSSGFFHSPPAAAVCALAARI